MLSTNDIAVSGWIWTNERSPLCLVVELVHVLSDEAAQSARRLPPGQTEVVDVGQEA